MQKVFVLDSGLSPLSPCSPARARKLLSSGKAAVYRRYPFTIALKDRVGGETNPLSIKFDPGASTTGVALVQKDGDVSRLVFGAELSHRGFFISKNLKGRAAARRSRRSRKTRYRARRYDALTDGKKHAVRKHIRSGGGWIAPSLKSRVDNIESWFYKLFKLCPLTDISYENVKFDTQLMDDSTISGVQYQQGALMGYEVREYLLEKWERKCAYCNKTDISLQIEHIIPKSRGGTNRISNLTLACRSCNLKKGTMTAAEFGHPGVNKKANESLKAAAAVNTVRWFIYHRLSEYGLPIHCGTGARTKMNRIKQNYPKAHWVDAACVGVDGESVSLDPSDKVLRITAIGRGNRQMQRVGKKGFPNADARQHVKRRHGFQTGDIVRIMGGKHAGKVVRISETNKKNFAFSDDSKGETFSIAKPQMKIVQRASGYKFSVS